MSHAATHWLGNLDPGLLGASEFRVLFHLCDCHNASAGCFPSQEYLRERAGVSNGTVNNVLNSLEAKGLIQRHKTRDGRTKRQNPTRYVLGFEMGGAGEPTPKTGGGSGGKKAAVSDCKVGGKTAAKSAKPSPNSGDGAVSNLEADPSPISGATRLQPTGEEPVSNLEITSARGVAATKSQNPMVVKAAKRAVENYRAGRRDALADLLPGTPWVLGHIVAAQMLTADELRSAGIC